MNRDSNVNIDPSKCPTNTLTSSKEEGEIPVYIWVDAWDSSKWNSILLLPILLHSEWKMKEIFFSSRVNFLFPLRTNHIDDPCLVTKEPKHKRMKRWIELNREERKGKERERKREVRIFQLLTRQREMPSILNCIYRWELNHWVFHSNVGQSHIVPTPIRIFSFADIKMI